MNSQPNRGATTTDKRSTFVSQDPRFLIVLFMVILISTFVIDRILGLSLLLVYIVALHLLSGMSARGTAKRSRNLAFFVFLVVVINAVLLKGTPLPAPVSFLSQEGVIRGIYYGMRVVVLYLALILFLSVTSQEGMAKGLSALLRPLSRGLSRRVALHGFLAIGFLPLFADELNRVRVAQGFRGGGIEGGLLQRIAGAQTLIVPLLISAIHRSGQLAMAVELRDIRSTIDRILVLERPGHKDFVFAGVTLIVLLAAIRV
jgi:energy-coupling factor transport system permease protein